MKLELAIKEAPAAYQEGWREGFEIGSTTCPYEMGTAEQVAYCWGAWYGFVAAEMKDGQ